MSVEQRDLNFQDGYTCPVCQHGQLSAIALMDAFACSFCRHIFTANLHRQSIQVEDSSRPMTWYWNGQKWQSAGAVNTDLTLLIWLIAVVLAIVPSLLVWLPAYVFPPLPGDAWSWFPSLWFGLTLGCHVLLVAWLLVEHYQLPLYVMLKFRLQAFLGR